MDYLLTSGVMQEHLSIPAGQKMKFEKSNLVVPKTANPNDAVNIISNDLCIPGYSKRLFLILCPSWRPLNLSKGHWVTLPNRSQRIARYININIYIVYTISCLLFGVNLELHISYHGSQLPCTLPVLLTYVTH